MAGLLGTVRGRFALAVSGVLVVGALLWQLADDRRDGVLTAATLAALGFVLLFLLLTEVVGRSNPNPERRKYGYLEVLIGTDGYASTSKVVVWLWTLLLGIALVVLSGIVWFGNLTQGEAFGDEWNSYLLLLGGPFASAVVAKGLNQGRPQSQSGHVTSAASSRALGSAALGADGTRRPGTDGESPRLVDLGRSSSGDSSLADTQYVAFSLVAMVYFVGALMHNLVLYGRSETDAIRLPEIPSALLGLTSLAALTYVGAKAVDRGGLRLVRVLPDRVEPGDSIEVTLVNAAQALTQGTVTLIFSDTHGRTAETLAPLRPPEREGAVTTVRSGVPARPGSYRLVVVTPEGTTAAHEVVVRERGDGDGPAGAPAHPASRTG